MVEMVAGCQPLNRFYGVMVSTLDSESNNPSSSLGRTCDVFFLFLTQLLENGPKISFSDDLQFQIVFITFSVYINIP